MKTLVKSILACVVVMMAAGLASAQTFTHINPPPCDFSDQFYADNGITSTAGAELNTEPDGRFGTFRQFGPPATGTQANWVADTTDCSATDPDRRNFRILATTGGNADDGNSPFSCADQGGAFAVPQCAGQSSGIPETLEFISILDFIHSQNAFESSYSRTVGAINGGLDGVQQNAGETISLTPGTDPAGNTTGLNPRGISMLQIVGHFEAYASINQKRADGTFALNPCAADMQSPLAPTTPCFSVADTKDANGNTISDVATPNLRQNWRFATNRNAMDGSDGNCINNTDQNCKHKVYSDSPYGYFCDDLLGMWIITYFWFTQPPNTTNATCKTVFQNIGNANGFTSDGYPVILTAHELNDELEANGCGAEGQENTSGTDGGAAWLVCPAIPDPRNGAIASDAFLDVTTHNSLLDSFVSNNFSCLKTTGKFCFESSVE
ncbi:MAG TPA: hypothetical protein VNZ47_17105 [Candidatus Dormibacteraeota bacterium]|nr:hypothetical protein [Candidatus Dormibacteraeota bacterium]